MAGAYTHTYVVAIEAHAAYPQCHIVLDVVTKSLEMLHYNVPEGCIRLYPTGKRWFRILRTLPTRLIPGAGTCLIPVSQRLVLHG